MVSVPPTGFNAISSVHKLAPSKEHVSSKAPSQLVTPSIQLGSGSGRLSIIADLIDKLIDIKSGKHSETGDAAEASSANAAGYVSIDDADIPEEHSRWLRSLGADSVAVSKKSQISDAEFEQQVLGFLKTDMINRPDFQQALNSGTVKVQRAEDVPESGFRSYDYSLYSDGNLIGGAHAETANKDWFAAQRENGIKYASGTVMGHDYYVTWN